MNVSAIETTSNLRAPDLRKLEEVTGQVVGSVFFGTMLKAMRESPLQGPYGHGGRGEEVFSAQLDSLLAERLGTATNGGVKEALLRHLAPAQERMHMRGMGMGNGNGQ